MRRLLAPLVCAARFASRVAMVSNPKTSGNAQLLQSCPGIPEDQHSLSEAMHIHPETTYNNARSIPDAKSVGPPIGLQVG